MTTQRKTPILDSIAEQIAKSVSDRDQPYLKAEISALKEDIAELNRLIIRVDSDDEPILHDLLRLLRGQAHRRLEVFQA